MLDLSTLSGKPAGDIIAAINEAESIGTAVFPVVKELFTTISTWIKSLEGDSLSTPHGKRVAIEAL